MLYTNLHSYQRLPVLFVTIIFFLTLTSVRIVFSQTEVAGDVSGHWTMDDSPVHVTENTTVPEGEELTIDPGVTILFARDTWLSVRGLITAIGTEDDSIIFTADTEDVEPGYWSYIGVATNEESVLSYCVIEYARIGVDIGSDSDHQGEVAHSTIRHMSEKGVSMTHDRNEPYPRVHHCHIYNVISDEAEEGVGERHPGSRVAIEFLQMGAKVVDGFGARLAGPPRQRTRATVEREVLIVQLVLADVAAVPLETVTPGR